MKSFEKRRLLRQRRNRKGGGKAGRILIVLALSLLTLATLSAAAGAGALYTVYHRYADDYVPIEEKLRQTPIGLTQIYDRNNVAIGTLTNPDAQLLNPVTLDQISKWVIEATVSTEDDTFFTNPGFNWRGLIRAAKENYVDGEVSSGSGGSSITQQLIKNVYICPNIASADDPTQVVCKGAERTLDRKLRELAYAIELEGDYTKEQILQWYLNQISYADRYIGIQAAAKGYFRKDAKDLTLAESALLAGVPSFPDRYHPRKNCMRDETTGDCVLDAEGRTTLAEDAKERQVSVLDLMVVHERITFEEAEAAKLDEVKVYAATSDLRAAAFIDNQVEPRLVRMCEAGLLPKIKGATDCSQSVHAAGYQVITTIDIVETEFAQLMMRQALANANEQKPTCNCFNAAIATIEPETGQIIVYAASADPAATADPRVAGKIDQLVEINQPGSSFKPIVYLTWMEKLNKAPMSSLWDTSPLVVQGVEIRNPRNDGKTGEGMLISARAALGGSQNVGAFRAAYEAGTENVIEIAKQMGITTLDQHFDPTFGNHEAVTYGASIATGGANIRAIDMAYANTVFANMGIMKGVPHLARYVELKDLKSTQVDEGEALRTALGQRLEFARGNLRIPGSRELDPVTVLRVQTIEGEILYDHLGMKDLVSKEVVNPGSVWLVHSIISDCSSRFIIWGCGGSNEDRSLDPFVEGVKLAAGVKTGTQQGPLSANDTLETWMVGYSRHAGSALWVGNSNNELVRDGPSANFAAANATIRLFKTWMGEYHLYLQRIGRIGATAGFSEIQPKNVRVGQIESGATDRTLGGMEDKGLCRPVTGWIRTDVRYASECEEKEIDSRNGLLATDQTPAQFKVTKSFPKLPGLRPDLAAALAKELKVGVPTEKSTGVAAVTIASPTNGKTLTLNTPVVGSVGVTGDWKLEIGEGASPTTWRSIGSGAKQVTDAVLGTIDLAGLVNGVYTVRLTQGAFLNAVSFNVQRQPAGPGTPTATATPTATPTPTPVP